MCAGSKNDRGVRLADLNWLQVTKIMQSGATAVLPIGASAKQHGPHLPMQTDYLQAEWLVDRLIQKLNILVWPTLAYGYYPAFADYPGSCSLERETFIQSVISILHTMQRAGAQHCALINTGISTIEPLEQAIAQCAMQNPCKLINVYHGERYRAAVEQYIDNQQGGHANEEETSIMLAMHPESVHMELASPGLLTGGVPGPLNRNDPTQANYAPNGVYGDPRKASATKGHALVETMFEDIYTELCYLLG
ncbi:creatininase family protein [Sulfuriflexus mobilis]|uniref:creatininase family protein n=1 Tax=Sulfuriflexus mobilis TaxID=1811807 RepID=UPI001558930D|nr:creatininase family protein [Sulfuriflexus mobilis]